MKFTIEVDIQDDEGFVAHGRHPDTIELNRRNLERIFSEALLNEYGEPARMFISVSHQTKAYTGPMVAVTVANVRWMQKGVTE